MDQSVVIIRPIQNDHSQEWHQARFIEFAQGKAEIGEPVPHMRVVDWLTKDQPFEEQAWLAGAYLAAYSVLTGEAISHYWPHSRVMAEGTAALSQWVHAAWAGFHTRVPRRCVRTPENFARCLVGFFLWQGTELPRLREKTWDDPHVEYDEWWKSVNRISFFGRYISIRLLELMRRRGVMKAHLYDIRAIGAHSPIRCLMLLQPDRVAELATGSPKIVNQIAEEVKKRLQDATGIEMSYFLFATLLCEYRACYESQDDYVGNQHDEELEYSLSKYAAYWRENGLQSRLYEARAAIDPHECLGEVQGWKKRRLDVAGWMRGRGIVWSDVKYDYAKSIAADKLIER
jgi:hypothetical protein